MGSFFKKKRWICKEEEVFFCKKNGRGIYIDIYYIYNIHTSLFFLDALHVFHVSHSLVQIFFCRQFCQFFFVDNSPTPTTCIRFLSHARASAHTRAHTHSLTHTHTLGLPICRIFYFCS
jgi:hypothetical protein